MRKKLILEKVEIEEVAAEGKTLARVNDRVVFIRGGAPGDVVDVRVTRKRKNYYEGEPLTYHRLSPLRTTPFCTHFGTCGGCKWQHLPYRKQLEFKQKQVVDAFTHLGGLSFPPPNPILGSPEETRYRNKLEFTFTDSRWLTQEEIEEGTTLDRRGLGFHMPGRFDRVLDLTECHLQPGPANAIRNRVRDYARQHDIPFYNLRHHTGLLRNLIIRTATTGQVMVILQVAAHQPGVIHPLLDTLAEEFAITSLNYVVNPKKNETFYDLEVHNYAGLPYIEETMPVDDSRQLTYRIGPKSFFQTNSRQAVILYREVLRMAGLSGQEVVYDLYTGTGTIANFIAHRAGRVIGLESVPEAIADARTNATLNGITNTRFFAGDIKDLLQPAFLDEHGRPEVVITDPPRAGMHPAVVNMLNESGAQRMVYVSCNPATQARDLALLASHYRIEEIQPVDMFPHTHHVENIVLLKKK